MGCDHRFELAHGGPLPLPLMLECNRAGDVVWMSEGARRMLEVDLGLPAAVSGLARYAANSQLRQGEGVQLRCSLVMDTPLSLLISAEVLAMSPAAGAPEVLGMLRLLRSMFRNILHLQNIHMRLSARVLRRKRGAGRQVVHHLEMLRKRLALDLHTGVGQHLTAIGLQLDAIERAQLDLPEPVPSALATIRQCLADARQETRGLSHQLNPPRWQVLAIRDALEQLWQASGFPETLGENAVLRLSAPAVEPSQNFKTVLYRAAQEALKNVAEHAQATEVSLRFEQIGEKYHLSVEDNGKGFDLGAILQKPATIDTGIGLSSIRDLVYSNGGEFRVTGGSGRTTASVFLPVRDPGEE